MFVRTFEMYGLTTDIVACCVTDFSVFRFEIGLQSLIIFSIGVECRYK